MPFTFAAEIERSPDSLLRRPQQGKAPSFLSELQGMHRAIGNQAVGRLLQGRYGVADGASVDLGTRSRAEPIPSGIRRELESESGRDLGEVRIHRGHDAGRSAALLGANAFTVGHDVVFGHGRFDPSTDRGRRLLSHELAHTIQQGPRAPLAAAWYSVVPETHETERGAASAAGGGLDRVSPLNFGAPVVQRDVASGTTPAPAPAPVPAAPDSEDLFDFAFNHFDLKPQHKDAIHKIASRVKADPKRYSSLRLVGHTDAVGAEAYNANLGMNRAKSVWEQLVMKEGVPAGLLTASSVGKHDLAVESKIAEARNRRVVVWFDRPSAPAPGPQPAPPTPAPKPNPEPAPATTTGTPATTTGGSSWDSQWQLAIGHGKTWHRYTRWTTPAAGSDPLTELVNQASLSYVKQHHGKGESGWELSPLVLQVQYSETTKQWQVLGGGQASYVLQLPKDLQWSVFAQALIGAGQISPSQSLVPGSFLLQPTVGTQIQWQPKDGLAAVLQATYGPTYQLGGPSSLDTQVTLNIVYGW